MKVKKVYKYGTGDIIPEGSVYLNTVKQTKIQESFGSWTECYFIWHYFLVEVGEDK